MTIVDPGKTVIEPLFITEGLTAPKYEGSLFKCAGSVKGLTVTPEGNEHGASSMKALAAKEYAAAEAAKRKPSTIFIVDNHSLATATSCWNNLKSQEEIDKETHPARFALVELQNLHDEDGKLAMVPPMDKLPLVSMTDPMHDFVVHTRV